MSIEKQIEQIITKRVNNFVEKGLDDKLLNKVGSNTVKQIVKRTRLGKGVKKPGGGAAFKLLPLRNSTIDYRDNYSVNLSQFTRPNRSNLTATGQLLDSITHKIISKKNNLKIIQIYFKENRTFELNNNKPRISHKKINENVEKQGRPFFYLAGFELNQIKSTIINAINKI